MGGAGEAEREEVRQAGCIMSASHDQCTRWAERQVQLAVCAQVEGLIIGEHCMRHEPCC